MKLVQFKTKTFQIVIKMHKIIMEIQMHLVPIITYSI